MPEIQKPAETALGDQLPHELSLADENMSVHRCGANDASFLFELSQDDQVSRFIPWAKDIDKITDAEQVIHDWEASTVQVRYIIMSDGQPIGVFGIWKRDEPGCCETGSALVPLYRGRGLANKVYAALEPYIAGAGFERVVSTVAISNTTSQAAVLKRGFNEISRDDTSIRYEKRL